MDSELIDFVFAFVWASIAVVFAASVVLILVRKFND